MVETVKVIKHNQKNPKN